jgi:hypothetical protein
MTATDPGVEHHSGTHCYGADGWSHSHNFSRDIRPRHVREL